MWESLTKDRYQGDTLVPVVLLSSLLRKEMCVCVWFRKSQYGINISRLSWVHREPWQYCDRYHGCHGCIECLGSTVIDISWLSWLHREPWKYYDRYLMVVMVA